MSNRRIVYHVTSEYMKKNKRRTFTTFLGIVFMVMLMTCVFVGKDTAVSYLQDVASQKDGKWHASLYDIDSEQYLQVKQLDYIEDTAVSVDYGYTEFDSANSERPFIQMKAYSKQCFDWMNIELTEGRFPESANEIVVSESAIADVTATAESFLIKDIVLKTSIYIINTNYYNIDFKTCPVVCRKNINMI